MDASYIYCGMLANIVQTKGSLHFITHRDHANYHAVERRHVTPQSTGVLCLSLTLWGHNDFSIYLVPEGLLHNVLNKAVPLDSASSFRATLQSFYELSFGSTYLPGRWDNLLFFSTRSSCPRTFCRFIFKTQANMRELLPQLTTLGVFK